jgi:hypothetical protein
MFFLIYIIALVIFTWPDITFWASQTSQSWSTWESFKCYEAHFVAVKIAVILYKGQAAQSLWLCEFHIYFHYEHGYSSANFHQAS